MKNWTDPIINWHQLPGTEVKRLIATWGMTDRQIANYDAKHGFATAPAKAPAKVTKAPVKTAPAKKTVAKKTVAKKAPVRQRHSGPDGSVSFVEHRNLYVGFMGGKVVVTKRTEAQCREFLKEHFGVE
jgi:hypothetical protein